LSCWSEAFPRSPRRGPFAAEEVVTLGLGRDLQWELEPVRLHERDVRHGDVFADGALVGRASAVPVEALAQDISGMSRGVASSRARAVS
jgi:hypothetical protein